MALLSTACSQSACLARDCSFCNNPHGRTVTWALFYAPAKFCDRRAQQRCRKNCRRRRQVWGGCKPWILFPLQWGNRRVSWGSPVTVRRFSRGLFQAHFQRNFCLMWAWFARITPLSFWWKGWFHCCQLQHTNFRIIRSENSIKPACL